MKRVLIIANLFHASPRIPGIATYLAGLGWEVDVLSPAVGDGGCNDLGFPKEFLKRVNIIATPYKGDIFYTWRKLFKWLGYKTEESITEQLKEQLGGSSKRSIVDRLMIWYQTIFAFPDTERKWKRVAYKMACEALNGKHYDVILSSSPFPTSHIVASKLKEKYPIFWLADFRDPWTQNHNYRYCKLRKAVEQRLEFKTLHRADAIVAAAPSYAGKLSMLHKKEVPVITNGFDPDLLKLKTVSLTDKFTMTYTGTLYEGKQDASALFAALRKASDNGLLDLGKISVRFYGRASSSLKNNITRFGLTNVVKHYGMISREESFIKQRESHVLLLFNWLDSSEKGVYPLKFFEYLSTNRPIFAIGNGPSDGIGQLLCQAKAGKFLTTEDEVVSALVSAYDEYVEKGFVDFKGDISEIMKYSYKSLAVNFNNIMNETHS